MVRNDLRRCAILYYNEIFDINGKIDDISEYRFVLENEIEQAKLLANSFAHGFIIGYGETEFLELAQSSGTVEGNMELRKALSDFSL